MCSIETTNKTVKYKKHYVLYHLKMCSGTVRISSIIICTQDIQ